MAITLSQVQDSLALWWAAYNAVTNGQTFSMRGRTLTQVDAEVCWANIQRLERKEARLMATAAGTNAGVSHALADFSEDN